MKWFWSRHKMEHEVEHHRKRSADEVKKLKRRTARSTGTAHRNIQNLNELLRANGITFNIHVATGGGRKHAR